MNKDIQTITYNHQNLPKKVTFVNGDEIRWTYDAAGVKLTKVTDDGTTAIIHHYVGGIEYIETNTNVYKLQAVYHSEGRLTEEGQKSGIFDYEYSLKDHLGNTRVIFCDLDNNGVISLDPNDEEIIQENHYYPFGLNMVGDDTWYSISGPENFYQYNGKELNTDFKLNWHSYGFRMYDAALGRFPSIDPIADQFAFVSPYNYAENTPIMAVDLHGLQKFPANKLIDYQRDYPNFSNIINSGHFNKHILQSDATLKVLEKYTVGQLDINQIKKDIGNGPFIIITDSNLYSGRTMYGQHNDVPESNNESIVIAFNQNMIQSFENEMNDINASPLRKQMAQLVMYMTYLNEYVHYGDALDEFDAIKDEKGNIINGNQSDFKKVQSGFAKTEFDEGNEAVGEIFGTLLISNNFENKIQEAFQIYMRKVKGRTVRGERINQEGLPPNLKIDPSIIPDIIK